MFRQRAKGGTGSANFHGDGEGKSEGKDHITTYFEEVDRTLVGEVLYDKHLPLLLVGTGYLLPIYKSVKYNYITDDGVLGNHDFENERELFVKAKKILEPYFKARIDKALANYYNQIATPVTTSMETRWFTLVNMRRFRHYLFAEMPMSGGVLMKKIRRRSFTKKGRGR